MKIISDEFKKVESSGAKKKTILSPDQAVVAIFKVNRPHYIPPDVRVRSRIDATIFTGVFQSGSLQKIESDVNVISVSLPKKLRLID